MEESAITGWRGFSFIEDYCLSKYFSIAIFGNAFLCRFVTTSGFLLLWHQS